jgi:hypothetical protein
MDISEHNVQQVNNNQIDLFEILHQIWLGRKTLLITMAIFFASGLLYIFYKSVTTIKEYESKVTLFVESPTVDSLLTVIKSTVFLSEVMKINLSRSKSEPYISVLQILDQQTRPSQGTLEALMNRINAEKGNSGILVITVIMQDQRIATQLADSILHTLTQFLMETQIKRVERNQKNLAVDTSLNFQFLREGSARNLQYLSKNISENIKFLSEGSVKDIRYLSESTSRDIQFLAEGSTKNIQFLAESFAKNIQFVNGGSEKNIQFLKEGYLKAETTYLQAQQALTDFYARNSSNMESIDSMEVKRLNSDIKLKYSVYSTLYQDLEQEKIGAKKETEQVKIEVDKQLGQAKIDAENQLEQAKIDAYKKVEQAKISSAKQLEQANLDAAKQIELTKLDGEKQLEQAKFDAEKQLEQIKLDAVKKMTSFNVVEPATTAKQVSVSGKQKVIWLMVFIGFVVGIGIIFGKKFFNKIVAVNSPEF